MAPRHSRLNGRPETTVSDGISWLHAPSDLVDHIFSFLPIRNAARNALVAKNFAGSWRRSRTLDFDSHFFRKVRRDGGEFSATVSRVVGEHTGEEIQHLKVYYDLSSAGGDEVGSWVRTAGGKGVRIVDLDFRESEIPYLIEKDLLDIETLVEVRLRNCRVASPMTLGDGLRNLRTLVLRRVVMTNGVVEEVVDRCLALETLDVGMCTGFDAIMVTPRLTLEGTGIIPGLRRLRTVKIGGCPKVVDMVGVNVDTVRKLFYEGEIQKLNLIHFTVDPMIEEAMLNLKPPRDSHNPWLRYSRRIIRSYLPLVSVLTVTTPFLEDLGPEIIGNELKCYRSSLPNLKEFQLIMTKPNNCSLFHIASFLVNCPVLEKLIIDFTDFDSERRSRREWRIETRIEMFDKMCLSSLKLIKFNSIKFEERENEIVEFFLKRSPALETLALIHPRKRKQVISDPEKLKAFTSLFETWKISPNAKTYVSFWWKDTTEAPKHLIKSWYN